MLNNQDLLQDPLRGLEVNCVTIIIMCTFYDKKSFRPKLGQNHALINLLLNTPVLYCLEQSLFKCTS